QLATTTPSRKTHPPTRPPPDLTDHRGNTRITRIGNRQAKLTNPTAPSPTAAGCHPGLHQPTCPADLSRYFAANTSPPFVKSGGPASGAISVAFAGAVIDGVLPRSV